MSQTVLANEDGSFRIASQDPLPQIITLATARQMVEIPQTHGLRLVEQGATPPPATAWVVDRVVARGAVTILAGVAKSGKSLLALQWAAQAAASGLRAAVVDAENGDTVIRQRIAALPRGAQPKVYEATGFDLDAGLEQLEAVLRSGCDVLVLDSWVSLWQGSETSVKDVKRSLEALRILAQRFEVGILLLHHMTKGSDSYRGSGAIAGAVEAVFTLTRTDTATDRILACTAMRLGAEPEPVHLTLVDGGFVTAQASAQPAEPGTRARTAPAGRALSAREIIKLGERGVMSKREQRRALGYPTRWWRLGK